LFRAANLGRCRELQAVIEGEDAMPTRRDVLSGAAAMLAASPTFAQDANWPSRPIRILIPTAPGGSPDIASRLLGEKITPRLGQPFVVESQTAGGGVVGL